MGNTFCKIEDSNKNKYILTDKNKQPLQCQSVLTSSNSEESEIGSCRIMNIKKILDDQTLINNENLKNSDFLNEDTKIPCKVIRDTSLNVIDSEPINKSNINFDNYNIASINKNIIIKDVYDRVLDKEIKYNTLYFEDKNNIEDIEKINDLDKNEIEFNKEIYLESMNKMYNYKQKLFIKEDISSNPNPNPNPNLKLNPNPNPNLKLNPNPNPNPNPKDFNYYLWICMWIFIGLIFCVFFYYGYFVEPKLRPQSIDTIDSLDDLNASTTNTNTNTNTNTSVIRNSKIKLKKKIKV